MSRMKAKLINRWGDYRLYVNERPYATTGDSPYKKLSLKNCQAIEFNYDLDELAIKSANTYEDLTSSTFMAGHYDGFKAGFQKALEILGDKKFSEEDVMLGWDAGVMSKSIVFSMEQLEPHRESYQRNLKPASLQQTEWDVEVTMKYFTEYDTNPVTIEHKTEPKLDADGCLILKRV